MAQETIAIAGAERKAGSLLAHRLAALNRYHLLLLTEEECQLSKLRAAFHTGETATGTEIINCLKDGCWEADIIVLDVPLSSAAAVADKIREVSTQKIVFVLSGEAPGAGGIMQEWQRLLPNAKVVAASGDLHTGISITGTDPEPLNDMAEIIKALNIPFIIKHKSKN
jgi:predicted dinucleotide-binding enzyme